MNLRGRLLLRVCTLLSVGTLWSALVAAQVTNGGLVGAVTLPMLVLWKLGKPAKNSNPDRGL